MPGIRPVSQASDDHGCEPLICKDPVSEGGLHPNPNVCWLVFSQLRAGHERGARAVDPVDNDGCVTRLLLIARTVSYFIWMYRIRISLRPAGPARSSLRGFRWE